MWDAAAFFNLPYSLRRYYPCQVLRVSPVKRETLRHICLPQGMFQYSAASDSKSNTRIASWGARMDSGDYAQNRSR